MASTLSAIRLFLRIGWLIPVAWMIGGVSGTLGPILPIYVFLAVAFLLAVGQGLLQRLMTSSVVGQILATAASSAVGGGLIIGCLALSGHAVTVPLFLLNWIILCMIAIAMVFLLSWEVDFESLSSDFRFGVVAICLLGGCAYAFGIATHLLSSATVAGVAGYAALGFMGLATGRRYAPEIVGKDRRASGIDSDWALAVGGILVVLAIGALVVAAVMGIDFVALFNRLFQYPAEAIGTVLAFAGYNTLRFVYWFLHLFPVPHVPPTVEPTIPPSKGSPGPPPHVKPHQGQAAPGWLLLTVKVVLIAIVVTTGLIGLFRGLRNIRLHRGKRLQSAESGGWSWSKMGSWIGERTNAGLGSLNSALSFHVPRRRSFHTVRDVYRALLEDAEKRFRSRRQPETAIEYGGGISARWPTTKDNVGKLNLLYMEERYGGVQSSASQVNRAVAELRSTQRVMEGEER